ncbi:MAG: MBOAT family O-acyltransferase, partial [Oscillospiraceae bacterium]
MIFSNIFFIFRFLPLCLLLYYIVPYKFKNLVITVFSLVFYSWGEVKYFPIMMSCIIVNFVISQFIEGNREKKGFTKFLFIASVVFNLGMLFFFKYADFFIRNINAFSGMNLPLFKLALPLGISFYTFQTMSYTIDVYTGKVKAETSIINFSAFVTMFPQLIAGPIVKYTDINDKINTMEGRITLADINEGIKLFIFGLGKKVLIANNVGALWTDIEALGFANVSTPLAWLGIIAYSLQIYFDFSGYSLMAIGLGKMLGFDFPANFNLPYISKSITEFWRRWHMTLSGWFKEYVYIPLGGNRKGLKRQLFNMLIVWFLTGFWHGADWNFML